MRLETYTYNFGDIPLETAGFRTANRTDRALRSRYGNC
jgi:hypothetical protein